MSTRCNVIIADKWTDPVRPIIFYRHDDGYPEGVKDTLDQFVGYARDGKIRDDALQAGGWLVILGAREIEKHNYHGGSPEGEGETGMGWKVGTYEPATGINSDAEYVHIVDLVTKTWETFAPPETHRHGKWLAKRLKKMRRNHIADGAVTGDKISTGALMGEIIGLTAEEVAAEKAKRFPQWRPAGGWGKPNRMP